MAFFDTTWYCNCGNGATTGYFAVPVWTTGAKVAGTIVRQVAPTVLNERLFACLVGGSAGAAEPAWTVTRGAKTTDSGVTWQECTGQAALCGDTTNAATTAQTRSQAITLGQVIYDTGTASVQICSTAGTCGSGTPAFSTTKGTTTADNTTTWTSLGLASGYSAWANPFSRIGNALASTFGGVAGNTLFVANTHTNDNSAAQTWPVVGSLSNLIKVLCVNIAGAMPPTAADLTTGALEGQTTGASNGINISTTGLYAHGIEFRTTSINTAGGVALSNVLVAAGGAVQIFKNCRFTTGSTSASMRWNFGGVGGYAEFEDCQVGINNVGQAAIQITGPLKLVWRNPSGIAGVTAVTGGAPPQGYLFSLAAPVQGCEILVEGIDLSSINANPINPTSQLGGQNIVFKDCLFRSGTAPYICGSPIGPVVDYIRSDSGPTNYNHMRGAYQGQLFTETSVVRSGGLVLEGMPISWKIVTTANDTWITPFVTPRIAINNTVTGSSKTVTVYGTIHTASLPNNDDIWIDVCYLGSASSTLGSIKNSTKATLLSANAALTFDGSTWGGGGSGAGWSPFKIVATLTSPNIAQAGSIYVVIKAAKPSTTFYIDPQPILT
jgi:hypothetical protein